jgi:prepilin-type N-terminal cleavage/methylation domain-containing protein
MEPTPISRPVTPRGFTLVEMMVVLAIIVIVTVIALLGQSSFNRSLVLTDTAYTIAFSIRQAQFLGISGRTTGGTSDAAGYGVNFQNGVTGSYRLYRDTIPARTNNIQDSRECPGRSVGTGQEAKPGDCIRNNATEDVTTYTLNNGFSIARFCGINSDGTEVCNGSLTSLNISYLRPNTQSIIVGTRGGLRYLYAGARIHVTSPDGTAERCITVSKAGHVAVHMKGETSCP